MKTIRLATAQFELTEKIDRNLEAILELSKKASTEDSRLIVFPECAVSGYPGGDMVDLSGVDPDTVQEALRRISAQAAESRIFIATGVALPLDDRRGWANALVVFDDSGRRVCTYSKTALTHSDQSFFLPGDSDPVFTLEGIRFGCQICYDVRFPEGYRRLFEQEVHVVVHSYHQAGSQHWKQRRDVMTAFQRVRCSENGVYAVTSNTIGHNGGKDQWIPSMIVDPIGTVVAALDPSQTDVLIATIDAEDVIEMIELDIRTESARQMKIDLPGERPEPGVAIR
jgi:NAD+ synthase (glutamine-hydrolysing)